MKRLPENTLTVYQAQRAAGVRGHLCHAPLQNLYWGRDGKVSSCCYNRKYILGKYPDQNVSAIWEGALLKDFRNQFSQHSLGSGCQMCHEQLLASNFSGLRAATFDKFAANASAQVQAKLKTHKKEITRKFLSLVTTATGRKKMLTWLKRIWQDRSTNTSTTGGTGKVSFPRSMEFELSNICNLECAMCFGDYSSSIRKNREQLPPLPQYYDDAFVEQLTPFIPHLWEAKFYGGEPFLIPIYYEIWEQFIRLNPDALISITTNGTIFNQKVARILQKLNVFIVLSIDSLVKETYEQIRKNANFDRVSAHLVKFEDIAQQKGHRLSFAVCPMTLNKDEIPELVKYCCERGIYIYFNTVWFPLELSLRLLPKSDLMELIQKYEAFSLPYSDLISQQNITAFQGLIQQLKEWQSINPKQSEIPGENVIIP